MNYYTYTAESGLSLAPRVLRLSDGTHVANPTSAQYAAAGAHPLDADTPMPAPSGEGKEVIVTGYTLSAGKWVPQYGEVDAPPNLNGVTLGEYPTQAQVSTAVRRMLQVMNHAASALAAALLLPSVALGAPAWWHINPTQDVGRVVTDAVREPEHLVELGLNVVTTNSTSSTGTTNDVWVANWNKSVVFRPAHSSTGTVWSAGGGTVAWRTNVWTMSGVAGADLTYSGKTSTVVSLNFGTIGGTSYTLARKGSYSIVTNSLLRESKNYTDQQAANALNIVTALAGTMQQNAIDAVEVDAVEMPSAASAAGNTFVNKYGENENCAVAIGRDAKAKVEASAFDGKSNVVARSVSVAIGANANATVSSASTKNQAVAIGYCAQASGSSAVAIGCGALHSNEAPIASLTNSVRPSVGDNTYASGSEAVAVGYSAKAVGDGAVQLGKGVNTAAKTLQFRDYRILGSDGRIPSARLPAAMAALADGRIPADVERYFRPGNMTMVSGVEGQIAEPLVGGLSEVAILPASNGVYMAGAECFVAPPATALRNYDMLFPDIPQAYAVTNGVLYALPADSNFTIDFSELPAACVLSLAVDPSVGYADAPSHCAIVTNGPCLLKVREPASNRVYVVVKAFSLLEDL